MAIRMPDEPAERVHVMYQLSKGLSVDYTIDGRKYHVVPRGTVEYRQIQDRKRRIYEAFMQRDFWTRLRMWLNGTSPERIDND